MMREPAASALGSDLEPVIGLEIHVQLATRTKMFCGDVVEFGAAPNTHVCPVCLGLPGALPVVNERAIELAVRAAVALECTVHEASVFARKHYFYPDLPKGYQITQFEKPLASSGWLEVAGRAEASDGSGRGTADGATGRWGDGATRASAGATGASAAPEAADPTFAPSPNRPIAPSAVAAQEPPDGHGHAGRVRIRRLHLEEDAGKSLHDRFEGRTAVDLNRAGVPLVEIVTEPDLTSPAHARAFLGRLKQLLEYLEVSDCDMEKGSLRVDANVSVRRRGTSDLGTKTEVKNLNSFSAVERALGFEIERQAAELAEGREVVAETRLWDAARGEARPMRSKEESQDYRYFPEPDLPPLVLGRERIEVARAALPELPAAKRRRFAAEYGLQDYGAEVLTATREIADYFEGVAAVAGDPRAAANWVMTDVLAAANRRRVPLRDVLPPEQVGALVRMVAEGTLSGVMARDVFERAADSGRSPAEIVAAEGLSQVGDTATLDAWVADAVAAHPTEAQRYRAGEARLLGFFMGEVMRRSGGKADPRRASELLRSHLGG